MTRLATISVLLWATGAVAMPGGSILLLAVAETVLAESRLELRLPDVLPQFLWLAAALIGLALLLSPLPVERKLLVLGISPLVYGGSFITGLMTSFLVTGMPVE